MFLISGATGLSYEVVWFKRFAHVWGSSSLAIATVVTSFLFGLGIGAQWVGRWADRSPRPLRWYGLAELGIGLLALAIPFEIAALTRISSGVEGMFSDVTALRIAIRFLLTLVVLGPPCFLMGGTLPLLVRRFTDRDLSDATGWFYGINTLGAALGCFVTGFYLLPRFGLEWTNNLTAVVNLAIGALTLILTAERTTVSRTRQAQGLDFKPMSGEEVGTPRLAWQRMAILFAAALSGCGALMLQVTWARQLAVTIGGSTYAFTATLCTVLIGIAIGGLIYHLALRTRSPSRVVLSAIAFLVAASAVLGQEQLPWLCDQVALHREMRGDLSGNAAVCLLASALLELVPSIGAGVLFPLLIQFTRQSPAQIGHVLGRVYLWNTWGSLIGASLTALVLFPRVGTSGATAMAIALYLVSVALLYWTQPGAHSRMAVLLLLGCAICIPLALRRADPRLTNFGMYLYGYSSPERRLNSGNVLFFLEGASSNVLVLDGQPSRTLRVNGKVDAGTEQDMATQLGLAYLPKAFHPAARDVLVIGYGSGVTCGASLLFPEQHVVCCEIEPAIFETSPLFDRINHQAERSRDLQMVFDDGRHYLQRTGRHFDLLISEPSNPWIAGIANLFTTEFFALANQRLRPDGVLAQWIQTYQFSPAEFALIVRTMRSVFPHCALVALAGGGDSILLGSQRPLIFDSSRREQFEQLLSESPSVVTDLDTYFGSHDFRLILLRHEVADETRLESFLQRTGEHGLNTDTNLRLEFLAPLRLFDPARHEVLLADLAELRDAAWLARLAASMGLEPDSAPLIWARGTKEFNAKRIPEAIEAFRRAIELDPELAPAYFDLAQAYLADHKTDEAIEIMTRLLPIRAQDAELRASLAALLASQGKYAEAIKQYQDALQLNKQLLIAQMNLAWILATAPDAQLRNANEAARLAQQACERTDFQDGYCLDIFAAALAEQGDFERASHLATQAIERLTADEQPTAEVRDRLNFYQQQLRRRPLPPPG